MQNAADETIDAITNARDYVRKAELMLDFAKAHPGAAERDYLLEQTVRLVVRPESFIGHLLQQQDFADRPIRKTAERVLQEFPTLALRMNVEIEDTDEETLRNAALAVCTGHSRRGRSRREVR